MRVSRKAGQAHLRMMLLSRISLVSSLCFFFFSFIFIYVLGLLGSRRRRPTGYVKRDRLHPLSDLGRLKDIQDEFDFGPPIECTAVATDPKYHAVSSLLWRAVGISMSLSLKESTLRKSGIDSLGDLGLKAATLNFLEPVSLHVCSILAYIVLELVRLTANMFKESDFEDWSNGAGWARFKQASSQLLLLVKGACAKTAGVPSRYLSIMTDTRQFVIGLAQHGGIDALRKSKGIYHPLSRTCQVIWLL